MVTQAIRSKQTINITLSDQEIGAEIILKALRQPAYHIAANAGVDASRIVERAMRESGKRHQTALTGSGVLFLSLHHSEDPSRVSSQYNLKYLLFPSHLD